MKKEFRYLDLNQGSPVYQTDILESLAIEGLHSWKQYLINYYNFYYTQKIAKAELYFIGGYDNEWLELTYYIETLAWGFVSLFLYFFCFSGYLLLERDS